MNSLLEKNSTSTESEEPVGSEERESPSTSCCPRTPSLSERFRTTTILRLKRCPRISRILVPTEQITNSFTFRNQRLLHAEDSANLKSDLLRGERVDSHFGVSKASVRQLVSSDRGVDTHPNSPREIRERCF